MHFNLIFWFDQLQSYLLALDIRIQTVERNVHLNIFHQLSCLIQP